MEGWDFKGRSEVMRNTRGIKPLTDFTRSRNLCPWHVTTNARQAPIFDMNLVSSQRSKFQPFRCVLPLPCLQKQSPRRI
jgi:hypothetical protein